MRKKPAKTPTMDNKDDMMFGDRLVPGPNQPINPPTPGPHPAPSPHPAPGPMPPPGLPTYPSTQFIEERFVVLRNEHTGLKNAITEVKKTADENTQKLVDVTNIATNGFAAVDSAITGTKTTIESDISATEGRLKEDLATVMSKEDNTFSTMTESFTTASQQLESTEAALSAAIEGEARIIKNKLGTDESVVVDVALKGLKSTIDENHVTVTGDISAAKDAIISKVDTEANATRAKVEEDGTSTRNNLTTAVQTLQQDIRDRKDEILNGQTAIKNHIEDNLRSALGLTNSQEHLNRNSIWDKINAVESKVDGVATTTTRSDAAVAAIHTETTSIKSTVEANGTVAANIKTDTASIKTTVESTATVANNVKTDTTSIKTTVESTATAVTGVASNVSEVKGALTTMSGTLTALNGTLASIASDAQDAKESAADAATDAAAIKSAVTDANTGLAKIEADVTAAITAVGNVKTVVDGHTTSLSGLATAVSDLATTVGNIENTISLQNSRLDALTTQVTTLNASVTTLTEVVSNLLVAIGGPTDREEEPVIPDDPGDDTPPEEP